MTTWKRIDGSYFVKLIVSSLKSAPWHFSGVKANFQTLSLPGMLYVGKKEKYVIPKLLLQLNNFQI